MEIVTKFNYEDKVWVMKNNKPVLSTITLIRIKCGNKFKNVPDENGKMYKYIMEPDVSYFLDNNHGLAYLETELFTLKDDLLEYLFNKD